MTIWSVTVRHLSMSQLDRKESSFLLATKSTSERDAVRLARSLYDPAWWEENILTAVEPRGELKAAEGLVIPQEELDY